MTDHSKRTYPPPMGSIKELSYQTGISESTIRLYVQNGWLPQPHLVGNKKLWIMSEVEDYIAKRVKTGEKAGSNPENDEPDEYEEGLNNVTCPSKTDSKAA